jgi:hypothetical protein
MKHELTTLQVKSVPKQGKLTRSPGYGGYRIKYKQRWDSVKIAVSNTSNIEVRWGRRTMKPEGETTSDKNSGRCGPKKEARYIKYKRY